MSREQTLNKIARRRGFRYQLDAETHVYIRACLPRERDAAMSIKDQEESFGCIIGFGLMTDAGEQVWTREPAESPLEFGARVLAEADMTLDVRTQLSRAIINLSNGPDKEQLEAMVKNCGATLT